MTTITINQNINIPNKFEDIEELKRFLFESFGYPKIDEELEKKWYKNGELDLCEESFDSIEKMKSFYKNLRK